MNVTVIEQIDTFSFSGTIDETGIYGDWTIVNIDGDWIDGTGQMSLADLEEYEGITIELEEDEVFKGDYTY